ncbi:MAG: chloride channel protein, partial [Phycisphaerales bacterium]|nr:chloride channel protein [Phycisphaerales bacterium]
PEVMDAIYRKNGRLRKRVAVIKSLASAATIGSGGSAGAEGPIVQIGSVIGSSLAQILGITREQATTLLGCGAAAGIASVFNAPIAGVFFVMEIILRDFSLRTFTPIVVASVFSTAVTQSWYGENEAIFAAMDTLAYQFTIEELPSYVILGLICGALAVGFIRSLYFAEDLYDRLRLHYLVKPVTGALLLGILGMAFVGLTPTGGARDQQIPPFFGNGYETIRTLLAADSFDHDLSHVTTGGTALEMSEPVSPRVVDPDETKHAAEVHQLEPISTTMLALCLLVGFKIIATCLTIGSGGSGGVFAPSLFIGAAGGATFGRVLEAAGLLPESATPAAYALVGMAAVVAATTHAPLTSILILFELTRDPFVLLPIMLAAVMATVVAQLMLRDSIYTLKLRRRGVLVGTAADLTLLRRLTARDINPVPHVAVTPDDPASKLLELSSAYRIVDFVVVDVERNFLGMVTSEDMRTALIQREAIPYLVVAELMRRDLPIISPDETLDRVLEKFSKHDVASLPLIDSNARNGTPVIGLITRARLMHRYQQVLAES